MAIIKHIASKNYHYTDSVVYLTTIHDEYTNKPVYNENGSLSCREGMLIDCINTSSVMEFPIECVELNRKYNKNNNRKEIKSHHYIISFDPNDIDTAGLTVEKAQELGMEFARKNFPGHQMLVATHNDGHNGSKNIHVHIVLNSVRKYEVEPYIYAEKTSDLKAGCKHHVSKRFLEYLKQDLMDLCISNNLNQVDLLTPAPLKVTEKEYHLYRRRIRKGNTDFVSRKDNLRRIIAETIAESKTLYELQNKLSNKHIDMEIRNMNLFFSTDDGSYKVSGKRLGSAFTYDEVTTELAISNRHHPENFIYCSPHQLRNLIDIENNKKAQESPAYKRKLKIINTQIKAQTLRAYTLKEGPKSLEDLYEESQKTLREYASIHEKAQNYSTELKNLREFKKYWGHYYANKATYVQYMSLADKPKKQAEFYEKNTTSILLFMNARDYLKDKRKNGKLPSKNDFDKKIAELKALYDKTWKESNEAQEKHRQAQILYDNIRKTVTNRDKERNRYRDTGIDL